MVVGQYHPGPVRGYLEPGVLLRRSLFGMGSVQGSALGGLGPLSHDGLICPGLDHCPAECGGTVVVREIKRRVGGSDVRYFRDLGFSSRGLVSVQVLLELAHAETAGRDTPQAGIARAVGSSLNRISDPQVYITPLLVTLIASMKSAANLSRSGSDIDSSPIKR